ncbi:MAG: hypothetical protein M0Q94_10750 [Candidatus Cloacimonetes bacterium]|nr:hypothetical protein [Candidatus Cloacimonadota bacterium]
MKLYLIVFLFICHSCQAFCQNINDLIANSSHHNESIAFTQAKEEFRRVIILQLLKDYNKLLGDMNYIEWKKSGQNINSELVNNLILSADYDVSLDKNEIHHTKFLLSKARYNELLEAYYQENLDEIQELTNFYLSNRDYFLLVKVIDLILKVPYYENAQHQKGLLLLISDLEEFLCSVKLIYPEKILLYKSKQTNRFYDFNVSLYQGDNFLPDFPINLYLNNKLKYRYFSNQDGLINLSLRYHDLNVKWIELELDFQSFLLTNEIIHQAFIRNLLSKVSSKNIYKINIFELEQAKFIIVSDSIPESIEILKNKLLENDWQYNPDDYNLKLVVKKIIIERKYLEIGVYYLKEQIQLNFFNTNSSLVEIKELPSVESIDSSSFDNCAYKNSQKILNQLREYTF